MTGNDEGDGIKLLAAGVVTLCDLKMVAGPNIHIGGEYFGGPAGPECGGSEKER